MSIFAIKALLFVFEKIMPDKRVFIRRAAFNDKFSLVAPFSEYRTGHIDEIGLAARRVAVF